MKLDSLQVGMIGTNCYLLTDETAGNATAVIDPGGSADQDPGAHQEEQPGRKAHSADPRPL